jgi:hypothetical protein
MMSDVAVNKTIRMLPRTLESVDRLREVTRAPSFSDTVKSAIDIYDLFVSSVGAGDRILIENKKGKQRQILIQGLQR